MVCGVSAAGVCPHRDRRAGCHHQDGERDRGGLLPRDHCECAERAAGAGEGRVVCGCLRVEPMPAHRAGAEGGEASIGACGRQGYGPHIPIPRTWDGGRSKAEGDSG